MRFIDKEINPKQLSPLNLAFVGDCVYEMLVRETLVCDANRPVNDLHRESVKYVSAKAQTEAFNKIKDVLTEEETAQFKRGRNAKVGHSPKSATDAEYHTATGVEALFGYLYLSGNLERIKELFKIINA
ncbi:MAG: ribonuclease III [Clostridiales bacterium]|nr:ribonuclease III [Clostridiales bacterium]